MCLVRGVLLHRSPQGHGRLISTYPRKWSRAHVHTASLLNGRRLNASCRSRRRPAPSPSLLLLLLLPLLLQLVSPPRTSTCAFPVLRHLTEMSRRSSNLELSIHGDQLEQDRIQLEHNLQHTDLSLHLSSAHDDYSDVEYPRHNSAPSPIPGFLSFEQRSPDGFDPIEHSQYNAWSMRSFNDDNTVNPYEGGTISTAAHHASALTLSAGLGGRAARRGDVSLSGAEYDPERPLNGIMASMNGHPHSLQADTIKSKGPVSRPRLSAFRRLMTPLACPHHCCRSSSELRFPFPRTMIL